MTNQKADDAFNEIDVDFENWFNKHSNFRNFSKAPIFSNKRKCAKSAFQAGKNSVLAKLPSEEEILLHFTKRFPNKGELTNNDAVEGVYWLISKLTDPPNESPARDEEQK